MENRGSAKPAFKNPSGGGIDSDDYAEEFSSDMLITDMSSAPSGFPSYPSLPLPSVSKVNDKDGRNVANGSVSGAKKLEHALPNESMPSPGTRMVDSSGRPPVGAFPVRSFRNAATRQTFRNEESKQEEGVGSHDSSRMAAGSTLYTVEAQRVLDGNEEGTVMVTEAQFVSTKWYQSRWIFVGLALFACCLLAAVVVLVVLVNRTQSVSNSLPPEEIACNFLSIPDVTTCQSTLVFDSENSGVKTTGSTIPSEIGLLTQLTALSLWNDALNSKIPSEIGLLTQLTLLDFGSNSLTSTIPSEIGLLTKLTSLSFWNNALTSKIPSAIGRLTQLTSLSFWNNALTSAVPSEIGLLKQLTWLDLSDNRLTSAIPSEMGLLSLLTGLDLYGNELKGTIPSSTCSLPSLTVPIYVDCGEITCPSGCCSDYDTDSPCG